MDQPRAALDIAYINAKTRIAITLAIGGMLTLFVGLFLLFFGATSQDRTLMRLFGVEVSAGGLGGVIMTTSVMWAFLAYKACPSYAHTSRVEERYDSSSQLLERVHLESGTQFLVHPDDAIVIRSRQTERDREAPPDKDKARRRPPRAAGQEGRRADPPADL